MTLIQVFYTRLYLSYVHVCYLVHSYFSVSNHACLSIMTPGEEKFERNKNNEDVHFITACWKLSFKLW